MTVHNTVQIELNKQEIGHLKEGLKRIESGVLDIQKENKEMFNHMSNRLPKWASVALGFLALFVGAVIQGVIFS